ncbi:MAG TPA: hypothetical protein VGL46_21535 [Pseudonocardiaceae bacterium]|jgi:hypothetical protein
MIRRTSWPPATVAADAASGIVDLAAGDATTTMLVNVLVSVGQFQRDLQNELTRDGLAAARAAGARSGRRPRLEQLGVVDEVGWGRAPAGYDVAMLYAHSLLQPAVAARVRAEFADELESPDGLLSQLYATARMLLRINSGDYADLAIPLHRNAERVIALLQD